MLIKYEEKYDSVTYSPSLKMFVLKHVKILSLNKNYTSKHIITKYRVGQ